MASPKKNQLRENKIRWTRKGAMLLHVALHSRFLFCSCYQFLTEHNYNYNIIMTSSVLKVDEPIAAFLRIHFWWKKRGFMWELSYLLELLLDWNVWITVECVLGGSLIATCDKIPPKIDFDRKKPSEHKIKNCEEYVLLRRDISPQIIHSFSNSHASKITIPFLAFSLFFISHTFHTSYQKIRRRSYSDSSIYLFIYKLWLQQSL